MSYLKEETCRKNKYVQKPGAPFPTQRCGFPFLESKRWKEKRGKRERKLSVSEQNVYMHHKGKVVVFLKKIYLKGLYHENLGG